MTSGPIDRTLGLPGSNDNVENWHYLDSETYSNCDWMFSIVTSISDDWQRRDIGGSPKDDVGPSAIFEAE